MSAIERLVADDAVRRLTERDPSLYTDQLDMRQAITHRLGWTDLAQRAPSRIPLAENLARQVVEEGATDVVLLGMGGSSLTALVFAQVLGSAEGMPQLHVMDTTDPSAVLGLLERLDRRSTYFLLSSKSGTTIEPLSLYRIFRQWMDDELGRPAAGRHFIAITDPGSPLEELRRHDVMRQAVAAPANVGGRFSALSVFGLVPAAMLGADLSAIVGKALEMETACSLPAEENPGASLAAWIADAHADGRDKLTLVISQPYASFGLWVEQLVAESTGKHGVGVVPIIDYAAAAPESYGPDRAFVTMGSAQDAKLEEFATAQAAAGAPTFEITLDGPEDIGAEFVRWEFAVAFLGHLLSINPFDEPNVSEAKEATAAVLAGQKDVPRPVADIDEFAVTYSGALSGAAAPADLSTAFAPIVAGLQPGDYLAVLAYLPDTNEYLSPLRHALTEISSSARLATCLELGPRYLHSTGQLHKGGADNGLFVVLTMQDSGDLEIPGSTYTLGELYRAQAEGDLVTLASLERRVMRLHIAGADPASTKRVGEAMIEAFR